MRTGWYVLTDGDGHRIGDGGTRLALAGALFAGYALDGRAAAGRVGSRWVTAGTAHPGGPGCGMVERLRAGLAADVWLAAPEAVTADRAELAVVGGGDLEALLALWDAIDFYIAATVPASVAGRAAHVAASAAGQAAQAGSRWAPALAATARVCATAAGSGAVVAFG